MGEFFKGFLDFLKECTKLLKLGAVATKDGLESINIELSKYSESFYWYGNVQDLFDELLQGKGHNIRYISPDKLKEIQNQSELFTYVGESIKGEKSNSHYYVFNYQENYFKIEWHNLSEGNYTVSCWGKIKPKCSNEQWLSLIKEFEKDYVEE